MNSMPQKGISTGLILILLGLAGYFGGGRASVTALIPAFIGIPLLLSSILAKKPKLLKIGMHLAAVFGLLGFIAPLGRLIPQIIKGEFELGFATVSMILMVIVCGAFTGLCVQSFRAARRAKA